MENVADIYELSPTQEGMLFHTLIAPADRSYFQSIRFTLNGHLQAHLWQQAWQWVVDRYPSLRAGFFTEDMNKPMQVIFAKLELPWQFQQLSPQLSSAERKAQVERLIAQEQVEPLALNKPPLMRFLLIQVSEDHYQFIWTHHHILLDGWCLPILFREVFERYAALVNGDTHTEVGVAQGHYRDFIEWQQKRNWQQDQAFWRTQLEGFDVPTQLLMDAGTVAVANQHNAVVFEKVSLCLDEVQTNSLQKAAQDSQVPLAVVLQMGWGLVLHHCSRSDDVVFGLTLSGRPAELDNVEAIIGLFINTVPVRMKLNAHVAVEQHLKAVFDQWVAMQAHQYLPLSEIQRQSSVPPGQSLFDTLLVIENYPIDISFKEPIAGLRVQDFVFEEKTNYPLTVVVAPHDRCLVTASFDPQRFRRETVEKLLSFYQQILLSFASMSLNDRQSQAAVHLGLSHQANPIHLSVTPPRMNAEANLVSCFSYQAQHKPDRIGLVFGDHQYSYKTLDQLSDKVAAGLINKGVKEQSLVGLCLPRSASMLVSLLGILKAGCVYVPLDPANPDERLSFIAKDAQLEAIISGANLLERFVELPSHIQIYQYESLVDHDKSTNIRSIKPDDLAYVIYTSGSTGQPKGVKVSHRNVMRLLSITESQFEFSDQDSWLGFHSYAFDFSVWEIWGAWYYGARLVLADSETVRSVEATYRLLERENITVFNQTPSAFYNFQRYAQNQLGHSLPLSLRYIIFGGEALAPQRLKPWFDFLQPTTHKTRLVNMYGITETTVHTTMREITASDVDTDRGSPIGRPLADLQCVVMSAYGDPLPEGIPGELYVGGAGVTQGYLHRPELTAERFIHLPDLQSATSDDRFYRSGDLVCQLNNEFEYLGRIDTQVKLRGYRIELDEIANRLSAHPYVQESIVTLLKSNTGDGAEDQLRAYFIASEQYHESSVEADNNNLEQLLKAFLQQSLPHYMIPAVFVKVERFPLTANGKLDTAALPEPTAFIKTSTNQALSNDLEQLIAQIWRQTLGKPSSHVFNANDNFFDVGGNSLLVTRVHSQLEAALQQKLTMVSLFTYPTIAQLAGFLAGEGKGGQLLHRHESGTERGATRQTKTQSRQNRRSLRQGRRRGVSEVGS